MNLERYSSAILAMAGLFIILGIYLALKLPNSLLPNVSRPQIELFSVWPGKSAAEIEQSLVAPLEQRLSGIANVSEITTGVRANSASTLLSFQPDADMKQAYIDVLAASSQVPNWPSQVAKPFIEDYSNGASATLASFFVYGKQDINQQQLIDAYRFYIEPAFANVKGVAAAVVGTPIEQRVDIEFEPQSLIRYSLSQQQVIERLGDLVDRSGGKLAMGSKEYELQFNGRLPLDQLGQLAIAVQGQTIIRLADIAKVKTRLAQEWGYFALEGQRSLYFFLQPAKNANALETIDALKEVISQLNQGPLKAVGIELAISRDDSVAIKSSLNLVFVSLVIGALLASLVLYYFLRHLPSVLMVFLSIPFCLSLVIILMSLAGFSLNVISLAGMALSIGLILDAAIIVLETIHRLRRQGLALEQALRQGVAEVRGAILSSTLSSIIVFLPMLFLSSAEGRLFRDLAFTISSALAASALFALVLLPLLYRRALAGNASSEPLGQRPTAQSTRLAKFLQCRRWVYLSLLLAIPGALLLSWQLSPAFDVLPNPKQNVVSAFIRFEDALSVAAVESEYAKPMVQRVQQQLEQNPDLPIRTHGLFCFEKNCQLYFYVQGDWQFDSFKDWIETEITRDLVGAQVFIRQGGLLRFAMPNSRVSQLDIQGADLPELQRAGRELQLHLQQSFPEAQIDEDTPLHNRAVRIEFQPKQDQLAYLGLSPADLNRQLQALTDGVYLGDFYTGSDTLPFYFKARPAQYLDQILDTEILVPGHGLVALRKLCTATTSLAPESIFRLNRKLSLSLSLAPANGEPMGRFVDSLKPRVQAFMQQNYPGLHISYRGSADKLKVFLQEFGQIFIAALIILAVLLFLTLGSWRLAVAVLLSMPLAIAGGMLNLRLLGLFTPQNLDIITMIGFIILMGLVINNAILLAQQFQSSLLAGFDQRTAIQQAVNKRRRAIYMSTGTSILGMLPLMISPANSAEIYRGLAAVICGGMVFSALFSIGFMSALLSTAWFKPSVQGLVLATKN